MTPSLSPKYEAMTVVADSEEPSTLLHYCINYDPKNLGSTVPRDLFHKQIKHSLSL
jgi:hypothetical protein